MIKWQEKFSVGYEIFDDHHKELIRIINSLEELIKDKDIHEDLLYDKISEIFSELLDYTVYHFTTEEKIFEEKGYELAQEHKDIHNEFIESVKEEVSRFELGKNERVVALEIYNNLVDWLMNHILGTDKKYMNKLD
ncbi:bacteriohemerythrin [Clostridiaceae bacterium HSG29]|nr:bacteriohemerythrin [Clostridiaceae bacterium HSG29]